MKLIICSIFVSQRQILLSHVAKSGLCLHNPSFLMHRCGTGALDTSAGGKEHIRQMEGYDTEFGIIWQQMVLFFLEPWEERMR